MLTEKECTCCHKVASHYLNSNIRGGCMNFAPPKLEIFATNDSRLPDASYVTKGSMLDVRVFSFNFPK